MNLLLSVLILIIIYLLNLNPDFYRFFYSADALYLPSLFQDVFQKGISIKEWNLQPSPGFFPDWVVFAVIFILLPEYSELIIPCFSVAISGLMIFYSLKILGNPHSYNYKEENRKSWFLIILLTIMLFLFSGFGIETIPYLFIGTHHIGAVISSFFLLDQILNKKSQFKPVNFLTMLFLLYLIRLSDELIVIICFLPLSLAMIIAVRSIQNKFIPYIALLTLHFISYPHLSGYIRSIFKIPHFQPGKLVWNKIKTESINVSFIVEIIGKLWELTKKFCDNLDYFSLFLFLVCLLSSIVFFIQSYKNKYSYDLNKNENSLVSNRRLFLSSYLFLGIILHLLSTVLLSLFWQEETILSFRYYSPIFIYGLVSLSFLLEKIVLKKFYLLGFVCILGFSFLWITINSNTSIYRYPPLDCLKKISPEEPSNLPIHGLSGYWDAKPVTYWSKSVFRATSMYNKDTYNWVSPTQNHENKIYYFILEDGKKHWDGEWIRETIPIDYELVRCSDWSLYYYQGGFRL